MCIPANVSNLHHEALQLGCGDPEPDETPVAQGHVLEAIAMQILLNCTNFCFVNATYMCCLWALTSVVNFRWSLWGDQCITLIRFLQGG